MADYLYIGVQVYKQKITILKGIAMAIGLLLFSVLIETLTIAS